MPVTRILVVDDQLQNIELLEAYLVPQGYEIVKAASGEEALEKLSGNQIDLILLDVMMPKMSGLEVLKKLRADEKTRLIPVVMVTVLKETEDKVKALEAGCDDFISKPFDKSELFARVKSLLRIKSLHEEVENSYKKLKELERLKDGLIHMVVHDLNNSLTTIFIVLQLLERKLAGKISSKTKEVLGSAVLASQGLAEMIKTILDINKMEEGKVKLKYASFNLYEVAEEVVAQMKAIAEEGKKALSLEVVDGVPIILADRELIRRVIANLINNAFKFTPSGGFVGVKIFFKQNENVFYVQIRDNGAGIPGEDVDNIFDKFVQVKDNESETRLGHGLGLTFCKLAVEAHGGRIWAESELGKGSVFTFVLPCK